MSRSFVKSSQVYCVNNSMNETAKFVKKKQESPADAGIHARRKNDEKIPPFRSYHKFQSSRKSGVYSN